MTDNDNDNDRPDPTNAHVRTCDVCSTEFEPQETGLWIDDWNKAFCERHVEQFLDEAAAEARPTGNTDPFKAAMALSPDPAEQTPDDPEVPEQVEDLSRSLGTRFPPTNPVVVMRIAAWWYMNGKGGNDPVFRWAVYWLYYLTFGHTLVDAQELMSDYDDRLESVEDFDYDALREELEE